MLQTVKFTFKNFKGKKITIAYKTFADQTAYETISMLVNRFNKLLQN